MPARIAQLSTWSTVGCSTWSTEYCRLRQFVECLLNICMPMKWSDNANNLILGCAHFNVLIKERLRPNGWKHVDNVLIMFLFIFNLQSSFGKKKVTMGVQNVPEMFHTQWTVHPISERNMKVWVLFKWKGKKTWEKRETKHLKFVSVKLFKHCSNLYRNLSERCI